MWLPLAGGHVQKIAWLAFAQSFFSFSFMVLALA